MKRLLLLGVVIAIPHADRGLVLGLFVLASGVLLVVAGVVFCRDEAPARRLRRLIRAIRRSGDA
jgi:hypothetical protein